MSDSTRKSIVQRIRQLLLIGALVLVGTLAILYVGQRSILFPTQMIPDHLQQQPPGNVEVFWHQNGEQSVEVWFVPGIGVAEKKPVVFFAHGNGAIIDQYSERFFAQQLGYHIVLIEYRGYGRMKGSPTEEGIVSDFVSVYDAILARDCLLYTSPSPRDRTRSRMPSSA